jgi:hypothetical protein
VGLYQRLQGRADTLIRKYGVVRTVTHTVSGTYNPTSGQTTATTQTFQVPMVTFPYDIKFINNTTIKLTDLWGLFSAVELTSVPQPGDKVVVDGVTFTFGNVKPMNPGGVAIYYEVHLTQG